MTDHPIAPPDKLVRQWLDNDDFPFVTGTNELLAITKDRLNSVIAQAARWVSDQELEAIRQLLEINGCPSRFIDLVIDARRPKPPSLKEQALGQLAALERNRPLGCNTSTIRRALEALSDD